MRSPLTTQLESILNERNLNIEAWNATSWDLLVAAAVGHSPLGEVTQSDRRLAFRVLLAGLSKQYAGRWEELLLPPTNSSDHDLAKNHTVAARTLKKYLDGGTPTIEDVLTWRKELGI